MGRLRPWRLTTAPACGRAPTNSNPHGRTRHARSDHWVDVLPAVDQGGDILLPEQPPAAGRRRRAGLTGRRLDPDWRHGSRAPRPQPARVRRRRAARPRRSAATARDGRIPVRQPDHQLGTTRTSSTWPLHVGVVRRNHLPTPRHSAGRTTSSRTAPTSPSWCRTHRPGRSGPEWHWGSDGMKPGDLAIFDWSGAGSATSGPPTTWASSSTTSPAGSGPPSRATSATPCSGSVVTDATCRATSGSIGQRPTGDGSSTARAPASSDPVRSDRAALPARVGSVLRSSLPAVQLQLGLRLLQPP